MRVRVCVVKHGQQIDARTQKVNWNWSKKWCWQRTRRSMRKKNEVNKNEMYTVFGEKSLKHLVELWTGMACGIICLNWFTISRSIDCSCSDSFSLGCKRIQAVFHVQNKLHLFLVICICTKTVKTNDSQTLSLRIKMKRNFFESIFLSNEPIHRNEDEANDLFSFCCYARHEFLYGFSCNNMRTIDANSIWIRFVLYFHYNVQFIIGTKIFLYGYVLHVTNGMEYFLPQRNAEKRHTMIVSSLMMHTIWEPITKWNGIDRLMCVLSEMYCFVPFALESSWRHRLHSLLVVAMERSRHSCWLH